MTSNCVLATSNTAWVGRDLNNRSDALPLPAVNCLFPADDLDYIGCRLADK
jgi:hypothetical protein